jgi:hypothetical protein
VVVPAKPIVVIPGNNSASNMLSGSMIAWVWDGNSIALELTQGALLGSPIECLQQVSVCNNARHDVFGMQPSFLATQEPKI